MINIRHNIGKTLKDLGELNVNLEKATVSTLNKTAEQARSEASRQIRVEYNISVAGLKRKDKQGRNVLGFTRATAAKLKSAVIARGQGINLKYFGARQTTKGVSFAIKRKSRQRIPVAFGPDIPRLGGQVFRRLTNERLPIKMIFGPGVAAMLATKNINLRVRQFVANNYNRILKNEINYFTKVLK